MVRLFFKKTWLANGALAVLVVAGVLAIIVLVPRAYGVFVHNFPGDSETYQAVFLNNDQIYFGHLDTELQEEPFMILRDVYYIQLDGDSTKGRLVKLGETETHRPTNEMIINREHILFWENLAADSPIVRSIQGLQ